MLQLQTEPGHESSKSYVVRWILLVNDTIFGVRSKGSATAPLSQAGCERHCRAHLRGNTSLQHAVTPLAEVPGEMVQDLVSCEEITRAALICWKMWTRAAQSGSAWETSRLLPAGGLALGYQRSPIGGVSASTQDSVTSTGCPAGSTESSRFVPEVEGAEVVEANPTILRGWASKVGNGRMQLTGIVKNQRRRRTRIGARKV